MFMLSERSMSICVLMAHGDTKLLEIIPDIADYILGTGLYHHVHLEMSSFEVSDEDRS